MLDCSYSDYQFTSVADLLANYSQSALAAAAAATTTNDTTSTSTTTTASTTAAGGRRLEDDDRYPYTATQCERECLLQTCSALLADADEKMASDPCQLCGDCGPKAACGPESELQWSLNCRLHDSFRVSSTEGSEVFRGFDYAGKGVQKARKEKWHEREDVAQVFEEKVAQAQQSDNKHVPHHPYGSVNGLHPDAVAQHIKALEVLAKLSREDFMTLKTSGTRDGGVPHDHPDSPLNRAERNRKERERKAKANVNRKLSGEARAYERDGDAAATGYVDGNGDAHNFEDDEDEVGDESFLAFHRRLATSEAVQEAAHALGIDTKICLNTQALATMSLDKYRLYCASAMRPKKEMKLQFMVPLTGNWLMPEERGTAFGKAAAEALRNNDLARVTGNGDNVVDSEIERSVDLEMTYYFNYDVAFLKAEKEYMEWGAGNDYIEGRKRMWAAEPLIKGR